MSEWTEPAIVNSRRAVVSPGNSFMRSTTFITKMAAITATAIPLARTAGFCSACFQVRFGGAT